MATATPTRKYSTEPTPLYALVGATDLAVESVRHAWADAARLQSEMQVRSQAQLEQFQSEIAKRGEEVQKLLSEPKRLQAELEQVPGLMLGRTLEVAAKAETTYEELAERGKSLVERLRTQKATQDLLHQGKVTISRTKAAVTTARHAAEDVAVSARDTLAVGRREAETVVEDVVEDTAATVIAGVESARTAARGTADTARRRVARTRSATRTAATSARRTAAKAVDAVEAAAEKIGD